MRFMNLMLPIKWGNVNLITNIRAGYVILIVFANITNSEIFVKFVLELRSASTVVGDKLVKSVEVLQFARTINRGLDVLTVVAVRYVNTVNVEIYV